MAKGWKFFFLRLVDLLVGVKSKSSQFSVAGVGYVDKYREVVEGTLSQEALGLSLCSSTSYLALPDSSHLA